MGFILQFRWLLLTALGLRLMAALIIHPELHNDPADYHELGARLANGMGYCVVINPTSIDSAYHPTVYCPTAYRPVGYPLFISSIYRLTDTHPTAVRICQAFLATFSVLMLGWMTFCLSSIRNAEFALWIGTFYLPDILYVASLQSETVFIFLQWIAFISVFHSLKWLPKSKLKQYSISTVGGLSAGLAALIKPYFLPLILGIFFYGWWKRRKQGNYPTWIIMILLTLAISTSWAVRNFYILGKPALTTNLGANLWVGNNPQATGSYQWIEPDVTLPETEIESDALLRNLAFQAIRDHPFQILTRIPLKWAHLFRSEGELLVELFPSNSGNSFAESYRNVSWWIILLTFVSMSTVIIAGWTGWWFGSSGDLQVIPAVIFLFYLLLTAVFFGASRFHAPLIPFFQLAWALSIGVPFLFKESLWWKKTGWGIGSLFFISVWVLEAFRVFRG